MTVYTCEKCGSEAYAAPCEGCGQEAAVGSEVTASISASAEQTVHFAVPPVAAAHVPRQRAALPGSFTTSYSTDAPEFPLPPLVAPHLTLPATSVPTPRLPTPVSAEQLAMERLRPPLRPTDEEDTDSHLGRMLLVFFLALALAVGMGYVMATALSHDIQAFFDSVIQRG